ncbi:hypothetical protein KI811_07890 [Geobacter hydrogenophilus]|nr:hypothetical protein [Geobacter hydrogenophilus]MBT0893731.1 hypothetical protein [Geobacter hydrogenophilus]
MNCALAVVGMTLMFYMGSEGIALASEIQACAPSSKSVNQERIPKKSVDIRVAPNGSAKRIINRKATEVTHRTQYAQIDSSTKVNEVCRQGGWSYIQVKEPEWLAATHMGWVPSNTLNEVKVSSKGKRIYRENEIIWDKYSKPYKNLILYAVNGYLQDECPDLDPSFVTQAPSRTTKKNPVFFVVCGKDRNVRNIFFSKAEIENRKKQER